MRIKSFLFLTFCVPSVLWRIELKVSWTRIFFHFLPNFCHCIWWLFKMKSTITFQNEEHHQNWQKRKKSLVQLATNSIFWLLAVMNFYWTCYGSNFSSIHIGILMPFSWHMIKVCIVIFFFSQNVTSIGQILEQRLTETCLSACCAKISLLRTHYGHLVSDTWNPMYPQWVKFFSKKYNF